MKKRNLAPKQAETKQSGPKLAQLIDFPNLLSTMGSCNVFAKRKMQSLAEMPGNHKFMNGSTALSIYCFFAVDPAPSVIIELIEKAGLDPQDSFNVEGNNAFLDAATNPHSTIPVF